MKKLIFVKKLRPRAAKNGFILVLFVLILPILFLLLHTVVNLVLIFELKSEFRYKCLTDSLYIQKNYSGLMANIKSEILLKELSEIKSAIPFRTEILDYPDIESNIDNSISSALVYLLEYRWIDTFRLKCGAKKTKQDNIWIYENLYSIETDKY